MTTKLHESNIDWVFDEGWTVVKYDDSTWYRKHFQKCADSAAVDFVALSPDETLYWLIEVKDFTTDPPLKEKGPLYEIVTRKARDTLAGLLAAASNATGSDQELARKIGTAAKVRVAFHCERPTHASRLFKGLPSTADLQQRLRRTLRAIDSKAIVTDGAKPRTDVPWTATRNPKTASTP